MRKIVLAFLIILVSASVSFGASTKVSELTETQTLTDSDIFLVSTYADGSYTSKYIAKSYLKTALGNMTTILNDTLWDAAGDLVYGTGANAGARLAIGAPYALLMTNSGATAPAWTYELGATGTRLTAGYFTNIYGTAMTTGVASTTAGTLNFLNATNANAFTITSGVSGAAIGWTLPTAAPGGANYLLNVDADGTMGYTDPSSLAGTGDVSQSGSPANHYWAYFTADKTITGVAITASKPVCSDANGDPAVCAGTEGVWQVAGSYLASTTIDDTKGNGDTTYVWSADKVYDQLALKQASLTYPVTGVAAPTAGNLVKWGASGNTLADSLKIGTFTDAKWCSYSTAGGFECTEDAPTGSLPANAAGFLENDGAGNLSWGSGAAHDALTLAGTPETNVFTLTSQDLSFDTQTANYIFGGPTSGAAAAPTFRALVAADIPSLVSIYQPLNATLTALAAQTETEGSIQYYTDAATPAVLAIGTAYQVLNTNSGATAPTWTSTLGATGTRLTKIWATDLEVTNAPTVNGAALTTILQPLDGELTALAGLTSAANAIPYFTGSGTAGVISSSADMVYLLGSANYAAARTNLGLAIGTNVQAYNADLATLASGGTANCLWGEKSDSSGIECKTSINIQMDDSAAQFKSATASKGTMKFVQSSLSDGILLTITPVFTANATLTTNSLGTGTYKFVFLETDNTFTGANTLGDGGDDQRIVSRINSTNERWSGHTLYFAQCAASMGFGQPAYIQSTGKPGLADADAAATMPAIGLVVVASTDADTPCTILTHGVITDTDWNWTPGNAIYVADGDAGAITATLADISDTNDVVQVIGIAVHADSIFVNPSLTTVVLE